MGDLIGWAITAAYIVVTVLFARSRIAYWSRHAKLLQPDNPVDRGWLAMLGLLLGVIWPLALAWFGVTAFLWRPADRDLARLERLEADLAGWRTKQYQGTDAERRMARDIVETLEETLKAAKGTR